MTMLKDFWLNHEFVPFLYSDTEHLFLDNVCIEKIWWHDIECARVTLRGFMPKAALLFDLKDGDSILLLRKLCAPYDAFFADEVVMACHDCRIRRKWLLDLPPSSSEQEGCLCIYVSLDCRFEIMHTQKEGEDDRQN
jgi:hypothetical protein